MIGRLLALVFVTALAVGCEKKVEKQDVKTGVKELYPEGRYAPVTPQMVKRKLDRMCSDLDTQRAELARPGTTPERAEYLRSSIAEIEYSILNKMPPVTSKRETAKQVCQEVAATKADWERK